MKRAFYSLLVASLVTIAAANSSSWLNGRSDSTPTTDLSVGHGDVAALQSAFDAWRLRYERSGGSPEVLRVAMGYSRALSAEATQAHASVSLNLLTGELNLASTGLKDGDYDFWLIDDGSNPGNTVRPDAQDRMIRIGSLIALNGQGTLNTRLGREQLADFTLESVVLSHAGKTPMESVVIHGSPDLMTKLYYSNQLWPMLALQDRTANSMQTATSFDFLLPKVAMADTLSDLTPVLGTQVALGRQLFHNETFGGNGRTCGTCHRADNNFTLDPNYIAKLPANDPLFVAETKPALVSLENPALMRKFGLILTNVDGPGTDVLRSVPHTLALATSTVSESTTPQAPYKAGEFAADNGFQGATGWSGDGAPGTGTLREFATGAVIQHFPKTMARNFDPADSIPDDFRLPTAAELDAIEAYSLSLGRSKDYPLYKLTFADALTQAGKVLFDTKENPCADGAGQAGGSATTPATCSGQSVVDFPNNVVLGNTANCNGCHSHAGARSSTTFANPTRNTGAESLKINPARLVDPTLAYDAGFGQGAFTCGSTGASCFGDGRFNTPPLIEAADTAPYFHNNAVGTLEEAIAAYNSDGFNMSPTRMTSKMHDRRVKLDSTQVTAIASFLRAINAMENLRQSNRLDNQARQIGTNASARELAKLAWEENQDAIQVLKEGKVLGGYAPVVAKLETAATYQSLAQLAPTQSLRNSLLNQAIANKQQAKSMIASCDQAATPTTAAGAVIVPFPKNADGSDSFTYSCADLDAL